MLLLKRERNRDLIHRNRGSIGPNALGYSSAIFVSFENGNTRIHGAGLEFVGYLYVARDTRDGSLYAIVRDHPRFWWNTSNLTFLVHRVSIKRTPSVKSLENFEIFLKDGLWKKNKPIILWSINIRLLESKPDE